MHTAFQQQLDRLDQQLEAAFEHLRQFDEEQLNRRPGPNQWSALQCFYHVFMAEALSTAYVQKKLSFNPALKSRNLSTRFRAWLLVTYLRSPFKFKAPRGIRTADLPAHSTFAELADKYRKNRAELRAFLAKLPDDILDKEVYKHPFAGRLPITDMLQFFGVHFIRHEKQARRALAGT